jgi:hypothetical protein
MEKKKLAREEREALRGAVEGIVKGLAPEGAADAAARLAPLLLPDPAAPAARSGLRAPREVLQEAWEAIDRLSPEPEGRRALLDALWAAGSPECRVVGAHLLPPLLRTDDEEKEAGSWETVRALALASAIPAVQEALAEAVARAMEGGAVDSWCRAFQAWSSDPDPRVRGLGPAAFAHLFGRGGAPEKLFDGLQTARRLLDDPDPEVRRSVAALLVHAGRRQEPAVRRFLSRFEADERPEVRKLAADVAKRLAR